MLENLHSQHAFRDARFPFDSNAVKLPLLSDDTCCDQAAQTSTDTHLYQNSNLQFLGNIMLSIILIQKLFVLTSVSKS